MVVTGTPGIGKSVFGLYLMYLLRCEGKTVVFELKGFWYRFSDEGVQEGEFSDFRRGGYLTRDATAWYLSDPKDRPTEHFSGTTVVLVSPNYKTTKEFLKLPDAERVFMPVWDVDELLECQRSVFPHVPSTVVVNSFGVVGGVARAIFNEKKLEFVKTGILNAADKVDVGLLRWAASLPTSRHRFQTDEIGDKLFHILSDSSDNFKGHTVTFASEYTRDLVVRKVAERGRGDLLAFVGAAIGNPDVSRMLGGGSTVGNMFERATHLAIGGHRADEAPFKMTFLNGSEVLLGKSCLNFGFTGTREFEGKDIASTFDSDIYYTPTNQNSAAVDSFGVDSRDDTLHFFQVKYAGAVPVNGSIVERYWNTSFSSKGASVKNCVFVYVVPDRSEWNRTTKLGGSKCWLPDAGAGFLSVCGVCVIKLPTG